MFGIYLMVISSGYHSETMCPVYGVPANKKLKKNHYLKI